MSDTITTKMSGDDLWTLFRTLTGHTIVDITGIDLDTDEPAIAIELEDGRFIEWGVVALDEEPPYSLYVMDITLDVPKNKEVK